MYVTLYLHGAGVLLPSHFLVLRFTFFDFYLAGKNFLKPVRGITTAGITTITRNMAMFSALSDDQSVSYA